MGFPGSTSGKEPACQCRRCKRCKFDPWVRKIPWRRDRLPTPVFLEFPLQILYADGKESACNAGELSSIPGLRSSFGERMGSHSSILGLPWCLTQWGVHLQCRRPGLDPWVGKIPWRRAWQSTPVFLPGESPWTEAPDGLQSMGLQKVGHDWVTELNWTEA